MSNSIERHWKDVTANIRQACGRCGRRPEDISLIAVSKTKPLEDLLAAYGCGARDFGENKVQEILLKAQDMPDDARFHMIGHLQRNKVRQVLPYVSMIHSVDSLRLAEQIQKEAELQDLDVDVLLEINVAEESSKYGFSVEEAEEAAKAISRFSRVHICGLMTIAPFVENPEDNRQVFRKLYQLSVDIAQKNIDNVIMGVLSMGMTGDYQVAIEEGATMIRVGTAIFGAR